MRRGLPQRPGDVGQALGRRTFLVVDQVARLIAHGARLLLGVAAQPFFQPMELVADTGGGTCGPIRGGMGVGVLGPSHRSLLSGDGMEP